MIKIVIVPLVIAVVIAQYVRSDGVTIYGYCFKDGDKDYSPGMGKGYPVWIDGAGTACKSFKCRKEMEGE